MYTQHVDSQWCEIWCMSKGNGVDGTQMKILIPVDVMTETKLMLCIFQSCMVNVFHKLPLQLKNFKLFIVK